MHQRLDLIYKKLYAHFGPQRWWPADTAFEVMVGAILTQNTSWRNVEKAIHNLKAKKLLTAGKLHKLNPQKLAALIRPAGYYNIKAKRLKGFLDFFFKFYQANIRKMSSVDSAALRRQLLFVNGIGPETADSILLYALNKPIFVVDAYTKRIFSRHRLIKPEASYEEVQNLYIRGQKTAPFRVRMNNGRSVFRSRKPRALARGASFMQNLKKRVKLFNEYHALLVRLGKEYCLKRKPRCSICPLKEKSK